MIKTKSIFMAITAFHLVSCKSKKFFDSGTLLSQGEAAGAKLYLGTRTPYPVDDSTDLEIEEVPKGFDLIFVQSVARHGSRGLSGRDDDTTIYNMVLAAESKSQLTPLGQKLKADLETIITANSCLGVDNTDIKNPGYGNLSKRGDQEHRAIGSRLRKRHSDYFDKHLGKDLKSVTRPVHVLSSGVDRAVDSSKSFKAGFGGDEMKDDKALFIAPAGVGPKPEEGVNRYILYFHKLSDEQQVMDGPYKDIFLASKEYQAFKGGEAAPKGLEGVSFPEDQVKKIFEEKDLKGVAREILAPFFAPEFLDAVASSDAATKPKLDNELKGFEPKDASGKPCPAPNKFKLKSPESINDLGLQFYQALTIVPALREELPGLNIDEYFPGDITERIGYFDDADDFYSKGPGATEYLGVTYRIARGLVRDFFENTDRAVADPAKVPAAVMRFGHAETLIPFIADLDIDHGGKSVPLNDAFDQKTQHWKGSKVSPLAANVQWEVYMNSDKKVIVRILHNERDAKFKSDCNKALFDDAEHFYDFSALKECYAKLLATPANESGI